MGFLFDSEQKFVNDNVFLHEERMSSQYARFLDKSPTYVTYYNINNIETTADSGFGGVERILGANSPVRFNEVKDFPIYGIDQIVLSLSDELQGPDTSYEGEAIILPNTVKPLPNDIFIIDYLDQNYLFSVTEIAYDTIKSNNFYRITFSVKSLNGDYKEHLARQTADKFNCIVENVGTKEKVLIREDDIQKLLALNEIYGLIAEHYKLLFFNSRYNSFISPNEDGFKVYDRYQTEFINKHRIFNEKRKYDTLFLTNEDTTKTMLLEYHNSIYRAIEMQKKELIKPYTYSLAYVSSQMSIFSYYRDTSIRSTQFGFGQKDYIRPTLIEKIIESPEVADENALGQTIIGYMNNKITSIYELDLEGLKEYILFMNFDHETFVLIPILLYILRYYYDKFMSTT